jgi:hypothetical protein
LVGRNVKRSTYGFSSFGLSRGRSTKAVCRIGGSAAKGASARELVNLAGKSPAEIEPATSNPAARSSLLVIKRGMIPRNSPLILHY